MDSQEDSYFAANRRNLPGIHPGLQDLIRVLGKQAHSASRTMILCEPFTSRIRERKYHKHCRAPNKPKPAKSWDNVSRPTALWSPIRLENYYYDCYYYRQYPERDSDYKGIEEKYNAIKDEPMNYSPPSCEDKKAKPVILDEYAKHRRHTTVLLERKTMPTQYKRADSFVSASIGEVEAMLGLHPAKKQSESFEKGFNSERSHQDRYGVDEPSHPNLDGIAAGSAHSVHNEFGEGIAGVKHPGLDKTGRLHPSFRVGDELFGPLHSDHLDEVDGSRHSLQVGNELFGPEHSDHLNKDDRSRHSLRVGNELFGPHHSPNLDGVDRSRHSVQVGNGLFGPHLSDHIPPHFNQGAETGLIQSGPHLSARGAMHGYYDEQLRTQEHTSLKDMVSNRKDEYESGDDDCVPYEDFAKLRNFKEVSSKDVNATLSTVEELTVTLRRKLNEISAVFEPTANQFKPPANHLEDARSETYAALGEIINLMQSTDDTMVRRLLGLKNSSLKMNDQLKRWQQAAKHEKRELNKGQYQRVEEQMGIREEISNQCDNSGSDLVHRNWKQDTSLDNVPSEPRSTITRDGLSNQSLNPTTADQHAPMEDDEIVEKPLSSRSLPELNQTVVSSKTSLKRSISHHSTSIINSTEGECAVGTLRGPSSTHISKSQQHQEEEEEFTSEEESYSSIPGAGLQNLASERGPHNSISAASPLSASESPAGISNDPRSKVGEDILQGTGSERAPPVSSLNEGSLRSVSFIEPSVSGILKTSRQKEGFRNKNVVLNMGENAVSIHQVVEITNLITDVIIMEVVKEMLHASRYYPPSIRKNDKQGDPSQPPDHPGTHQSKRIQGKGGFISPQASNQLARQSSVMKNQRKSMDRKHTPNGRASNVSGAAGHQIDSDPSSPKRYSSRIPDFRKSEARKSQLPAAGFSEARKSEARKSQLPANGSDIRLGLQNLTEQLESDKSIETIPQKGGDGNVLREPSNQMVSRPSMTKNQRKSVPGKLLVDGTDSKVARGASSSGQIDSNSSSLKRHPSRISEVRKSESRKSQLTVTGLSEARKSESRKSQLPVTAISEARKSESRKSQLPSTGISEARQSQSGRSQPPMAGTSGSRKSESRKSQLLSNRTSKARKSESRKSLLATGSDVKTGSQNLTKLPISDKMDDGTQQDERRGHISREPSYQMASQSSILMNQPQWGEHEPERFQREDAISTVPRLQNESSVSILKTQYSSRRSDVRKSVHVEEGTTQPSSKDSDQRASHHHADQGSYVPADVGDHRESIRENQYPSKKLDLGKPLQTRSGSDLGSRDLAETHQHYCQESGEKASFEARASRTSVDPPRKSELGRIQQAGGISEIPSSLNRRIDPNASDLQYEKYLSRKSELGKIDHIGGTGDTKDGSRNHMGSYRSYRESGERKSHEERNSYISRDSRPIMDPIVTSLQKVSTRELDQRDHQNEQGSKLQTNSQREANLWEQHPSRKVDLMNPQPASNTGIQAGPRNLVESHQSYRKESEQKASHYETITSKTSGNPLRNSDPGELEHIRESIDIKNCSKNQMGPCQSYRESSERKSYEQRNARTNEERSSCISGGSHPVMEPILTSQQKVSSRELDQRNRQNKRGSRLQSLEESILEEQHPSRKSDLRNPQPASSTGIQTGSRNLKEVHQSYRNESEDQVSHYHTVTSRASGNASRKSDLVKMEQIGEPIDIKNGSKNQMGSYRSYKESGERKSHEERSSCVSGGSRPMMEPILTSKQKGPPTELLDLRDHQNEGGSRLHILKESVPEEQHSSRKPELQNPKPASCTGTQIGSRNLTELHRSYHKESGEKTSQYDARASKTLGNASHWKESSSLKHHEENETSIVRSHKRQPQDERGSNISPEVSGLMASNSSKLRNQVPTRKSDEQGNLQLEKLDQRRHQEAGTSSNNRSHYQSNQFISKELEQRKSYEEVKGSNRAPIDGPRAQFEPYQLDQDQPRRHPSHRKERGYSTVGGANHLREPCDHVWEPVREDGYTPGKPSQRISQQPFISTKNEPDPNKTSFGPVSSYENRTYSSKQSKQKTSYHEETHLSPIARPNQRHSVKNIPNEVGRDPSKLSSNRPMLSSNQQILQPSDLTESSRKMHRRSRSLSPSFIQSSRPVTCRLEEERLRGKLATVTCRLEEKRLREKLATFQLDEDQPRSHYAGTSGKATYDNTGADRNRIPIVSVCDHEDSKEVRDYVADNSILFFARLTENAFPPTKESYGAPGFMLRSAYDYSVPARGMVIVKTDLRVELPPNSYGRIAPRRCLAENFGISVGSDVIGQDEDITVLLFNHSDQPFPIRRGNKVAQLICESIHCSAVQENQKLLK